MDEPPRVKWADFLPRFKWRQGEHVALIGPTGQGKTTLALELLPRRASSLIIATKPRDRTLSGLTGRGGGYTRVREWPPPNSDTRRVLFWPKWATPADDRRQARSIDHALHEVFRSESWCVFVDDVQHLTEHLKLRSTLTALWLQARSLDISVLSATQRPRIAPLEMFNQSSHLFLWNTGDDDDLRRLGGLGGMSGKEVRAIVGKLPRYQSLYVNVRDRTMAITKAERTR
jgi:hypothetical protein